MKRWGIAFLIALFWSGLIVLTRSTSTELLRDTDTLVMIERIEARKNALSWFTGDWPLENHFYRPIVTLTFESDLAIFGQSSRGMAFTNALLCALCILALFWFARELTNQVIPTVAATSLFALWHLLANPPPAWIATCCMTLAGVGALAMIAAAVGRRPVLPALFATGLFTLIAKEAPGIEQFRGGMVEWIPGRTASTMAFFCLLALAAYARYERLSAERRPPDPGPLDPPATRGTEIQAKVKAPWLWGAVSLICVALALGSYEQAVMLPALVVGVALAMKLQHYRVRWLWSIGAWGVLVAYLVFRNQVLPTGTSGYQAQQFRSGPGVYLSITDYLFPAGREVVALQAGADLGWVDVMLAHYGDIFMVLANVVAVWGLIAYLKRTMKRRERPLPVALLFALAASFFAFLPMAWMKPFSAYNHYHYLPLALRSVYVVALIWVALDWLIAAYSPQELRAPQRPSPAPGSLPHR